MDVLGPPQACGAQAAATLPCPLSPQAQEGLDAKPSLQRDTMRVGLV